MNKNRLVHEGDVDLILPKKVSKDQVPRKSETVFYNPEQVFNRDISVVVLRTYSKTILKDSKINICDAFAASGVRGLRYAKNIDNIKILVFNDLNPDAIKILKKNIELNKEKINTLNYKIKHIDAAKCLSRSESRFDIIDIDPFGSPARYIYPALLNLNNKGVLCLTATDMTVLTGIYPRKLYKDYGITHITRSLSFCHELAVRILISAAQKIALQQRFGLYPILSFAADHYVRVFLVRKRNKKQVVDNTGYILYCPNCDFRQKLNLNEHLMYCPDCNTKMKMLGPLWLGKTSEETFIRQCQKEMQESGLMLPTKKRISKFLNILKEESKINVPWYYSLHSLCENHSHLSPPPKKEFLEFLKKKHESSLTIYSPISIKTILTANQIREEIHNYHSSKNNEY